MTRFLDRMRSAAINRFPWERFALPGRDGSVHFLMHAAGGSQPLHLNGLYQVKSAEQLQEELQVLENHFHFISTNEYVERSRADGLKVKKPFATFSCDDGLVEFKHGIWPVLQRHAIPCTLFVVQRFAEQGEVLYRFKSAVAVSMLKEKIQKEENQRKRQRLERQCGMLLSIHAPAEHPCIEAIAYEHGLDLNGYFTRQRLYLNRAELLTLVQQGLRLGSHGIRHHHGKYLNKREIEEDIIGCAEYIAALSRQKTVEHAFPFNSDGMPMEHLIGILKRTRFITHYFDTGRSFNRHPDISGRVPMDMMAPGEALRRYAFVAIEEKALSVVRCR